MGLLPRGSCAVAVASLLSLGVLGCAGGSPPSASGPVGIAEPQMTALISPPSSGAGAGRGARRSVQVVPQQTAHVTPVSQPRRRTAQDPAARDLRVMSFNVRLAIFIDAMNHWGFRKGLVVETIRKFDPDLLGTQEALAGQSDYLRGQLSDYDFVGAGRNDGARSGEMCGVFFRRARFDKIDAGHFWLSERPDEPGSKSWGTSFTRMCTWVKLRDRADGSVMCLFNTHFDHRGKRAREQAARLLRRKVDQIAGALPVVITGDFNTDENTPPYRTLLAGTRAGDERFVDTFRAHDRVPDRAEGTRHDFWGGRGGPRIDWIVTDGSFQTVSASIDHTSAGGRYPSDHFPVTAVLRPAASSSMGVARVE